MQPFFLTITKIGPIPACDYISYAADGENGGGPSHALPTSMAAAM